MAIWVGGYIDRINIGHFNHFIGQYNNFIL